MDSLPFVAMDLVYGLYVYMVAMRYACYVYCVGIDLVIDQVPQMLALNCICYSLFIAYLIAGINAKQIKKYHWAFAMCMHTTKAPRGSIWQHPSTQLVDLGTVFVLCKEKAHGKALRQNARRRAAHGKLTGTLPCVFVNGARQTDRHLAHGEEMRTAK